MAEPAISEWPAKIHQAIEASIAASGGFDRWLRYDTTVVFTVGDPEVGGYELRFSDREYAIRYLAAKANCEWNFAYDAVCDSPKTVYVSWEHKGTASVTYKVKEIEQVLIVLNEIFKKEVRIAAAKNVPLTAEVFYAVCYGLEQCNQKIASWKLKAFVRPPGFEMNTPFREEEVRRTLLQLAEDPTVCYSES